MDFSKRERSEDDGGVWITKGRGSNEQEYQIYLSCADDGNGGDITRDGEPLLSFDEWMNS